MVGEKYTETFIEKIFIYILEVCLVLATIPIIMEYHGYMGLITLISIILVFGLIFSGIYVFIDKTY